jgi:two-component sensor histidine kinase
LLERLMRNPALVPPERRVTVRCSTVSMVVPVEQAIGLVLIAVEAVTNAIKHAFPDGRQGTVDVVLDKAGEAATLAIHDDGRGLPTGPARTGRAGLQLIEALAWQIGGTLELRGEAGTRVTVVFRLDGSAKDRRAHAAAGAARRHPRSGPVAAA